MYMAIESGQGANLPPLYTAYSPAIVQHSPIVWNAHNSLGNTFLATRCKLIEPHNISCFALNSIVAVGKAVTTVEILPS